MIVKRILPFAKSLIEDHVSSTSIVIDATCGNGLDTYFLAQLVPDGYVYACDIQTTAVHNTLKRINSFNNVEVHQISHDRIMEVIPVKHHQHIDAAMFNLGYLPKGDKTIVTQPDTTLNAINTIFNQLSPEGIIVIVVYPGHPEGKVESEKIEDVLSHFNQDNAHVLKYTFINQKNNPPYVLAIEKRA
ncbi:tRNA (mnm(5)s(2)U34)-methyltransferase [Staphylococcus canis]|uniref:Methyltransferase domain-containing protein n=1 Tax=Staphylococcus canis TaxID=2724942 RepID=A0ABS0TD62_9STAP|nr:class I SAM-dependent methyltransferase [Staphylococcus canis]MBI5975679.1 methyltransferase domain-containing protein [Staphylococcus canis]